MPPPTRWISNLFRCDMLSLDVESACATCLKELTVSSKRWGALWFGTLDELARWKKALLGQCDCPALSFLPFVIKHELLHGGRCGIILYFLICSVAFF